MFVWLVYKCKRQLLIGLTGMKLPTRFAMYFNIQYKWNTKYMWN